jgi:hypothetical protein
MKEITFADCFISNLLPKCGYGKCEGRYIKEL